MKTIIFDIKYKPPHQVRYSRIDGGPYSKIENDEEQQVLNELKEKIEPMQASPNMDQIFCLYIHFNGINLANEELFSILKNINTPMKITLDQHPACINLTPDTAKKLAELTTLKRLSIQHQAYPLGDEFITFYEQLAQSTSLEKLNLKNLGQQQICFILERLAQQTHQTYPTLSTLNLTSNALGESPDATLTTFAQLKKTNYFKNISLSDNALNELNTEQAGRLGQFIAGMPCLERLDLSQNQLGLNPEATAALLTEIGQSSTLIQLDVSINNLGTISDPQQTQRIADAMASWQNMQKVSIAWNQLGQHNLKGAITLCQGIAHSSVTTLSLAQNPIGKLGPQIGNLIAQLGEKIEHLHLEQCLLCCDTVDLKGLKRFWDTLARWPRLKTLHLQEHDFQKGVEATRLPQALSASKTLEALTLEGWDLNTATEHELDYDSSASLKMSETQLQTFITRITSSPRLKSFTMPSRFRWGRGKDGQIVLKALAASNIEHLEIDSEDVVFLDLSDFERAAYGSLKTLFLPMLLTPLESFTTTVDNIMAGDCRDDEGEDLAGDKEKVYTLKRIWHQLAFKCYSHYVLTKACAQAFSPPDSLAPVPAAAAAAVPAAAVAAVPAAFAEALSQKNPTISTSIAQHILSFLPHPQQGTHRPLAICACPFENKKLIEKIEALPHRKTPSASSSCAIM